jgi:hypothetical protein
MIFRLGKALVNGLTVVAFFFANKNILNILDI